jgi:hypothetical protein
MNSLLPAAFIVISATLSAFAGPEKLIGTWKSNKGATVAHLKIHTQLTPSQIEKISTVLGQLVIVIDAQTMTMTHGDWKAVTKYKILEETGNTVTFEAQDLQTKKLVKGLFEFDMSGKGFWATSDADKIAGYKERFDKVEKESRTNPPAPAAKPPSKSR